MQDELKMVKVVKTEKKESSEDWLSNDIKPFWPE